MSSCDFLPLFSFQAVRLAEIFKSPQLAGHFEQHLKRCFCSENLDFIRTVAQYRSLADVSARAELGRAIYAQFLAPGADAEINIPCSTRTELEAGYSSGMINVFDTAAVDVLRMLEHDSAFAFFTTATYKGPSPLLVSF